MSKARNKMGALGHRVMRRKAKKREPVSLAWKDKLAIGGVIFGVVALMLGICVFISSQSYRRAIEGRVERWRIKHHLGESQVEELMALEQEFHAHDKALSIRSRPTDDEKREHRNELAKILGAKDPEQIAEEPIK